MSSAYSVFLPTSLICNTAERTEQQSSKSLQSLLFDFFPVEQHPISEWSNGRLGSFVLVFITWIWLSSGSFRDAKITAKALDKMAAVEESILRRGGSRTSYIQIANDVVLTWEMVVLAMDDRLTEHCGSSSRRLLQILEQSYNRGCLVGDQAYIQLYLHDAFSSHRRLHKCEFDECPWIGHDTTGGCTSYISTMRPCTLFPDNLPPCPHLELYDVLHQLSSHKYPMDRGVWAWKEDIGDIILQIERNIETGECLSYS